MKNSFKESQDQLGLLFWDVIPEWRQTGPVGP